MALLGVGEVAQAVEPEHVRLDLRLRDLLADGHIGAGAAIPGKAGQLRDDPLEPSRLGEATTLETEDRHRDLPARSRLAYDVAVLDHRSREEDLAKLTAAGHLLDPPHFDARLMHVDQEERDAPVRLGIGVAAREEEAPVGVVRAARPGLLPVQDPVPVVALRPSAQARQVAACVGLAEALAEVQVARKDLLDVCVLLPLRSMDEKSRRQEADAKPAEDDGRPRLLHLLLVDRLHDRGRLAAARLLRAHIKASYVNRARVRPWRPRWRSFPASGISTSATT